MLPPLDWRPVPLAFYLLQDVTEFLVGAGVWMTMMLITDRSPGHRPVTFTSMT
jgi:hypothetical protein